jgi:hypothetical protein
VTWTSRTSAADNYWTSVAYGNGVFVAVACGIYSACDSAIGDYIMTSPDGITWTSRTDPANNSWNSVTYGNGLFVAVASSGSGNRVMTSPNGTTWTSRTSAANNSWSSVTYGNGLFVAVSTDGTVMTSPNGINWTSQTASAANSWNSVTYGNGLFVAVSSSGTGNRVMTSSDGITWTSRTSAANNSWTSVTYGNGLFVAVSSDGTYRAMTSSNGINWALRNTFVSNSWKSITYGDGLIIAGDLFDKQANKSIINKAYVQFNRLGKSQINVYLVKGDEDAKVKLSKLPSNVRLFRNNSTFSINGYKIGLFHGRPEDIILRSKVDYLALGHFHDFTKLNACAYYSGSPIPSLKYKIKPRYVISVKFAGKKVKPIRIKL